MLISFVIMIVTFALVLIANVTTSLDMGENTTIIFKRRLLRINAQLEIVRKTREAYDLGQELVGCPAGSKEDPGLNLGLKLCWLEIEEGCFLKNLENGQKLCISGQRGPSGGSPAPATPPPSLPLLRQYEKGIYTGLSLNVEPVRVGGSSTKALAYVTFPVKDIGNNLNSNYVDCTMSHTECFSIAFCLNGEFACSGLDKIVQTFAIRQF